MKALLTVYTECKYGGPLGRRMDEFHESEASLASVKNCFENASAQKSLRRRSYRPGYEFFVLLNVSEGREIFHRKESGFFVVHL